MKRVLVILVVILLLGSTPLYAVNGVEEWGYSKEIQYENEVEYKQVFLDEEIYRYAKEDLSDIRIINDEDEFVPYYIYNRYLSDTEVSYREYKSVELMDFMKKNDRYIDFQILSPEASRDIEGNQLIFDILDSNFLKNIKVYGSYDNEKWHYIKQDYLYRTNEAEKLRVSLEGSYKYEYYRIVFLNELDHINAQGMELHYNQREVRYDHYIKTLSADFEVEVKEQEKKTEILINNENHLKISEIKIVSEDNFKRDYMIYSSKEEDESFRRVGTGEIYQIQLDNFVDKKNIIDLEGGSLQYLNQNEIKVIIHDFDNRPINIEDIEITYYVDKLVFPSGAGGSYRILFGNGEAQKPIYDLVSYQQHIEELDQEKVVLLDMIKLMEEKEKVQKNNWLNQKVILNSILVLVSILLVFIILKKSGFKEI